LPVVVGEAKHKASRNTNNGGSNLSAYQLPDPFVVAHNFRELSMKIFLQTCSRFL